VILISPPRSGGEVRITEAQRPERISPGRRGCQVGIAAYSACIYKCCAIWSTCEMYCDVVASRARGVQGHEQYLRQLSSPGHYTAESAIPHGIKAGAAWHCIDQIGPAHNEPGSAADHAAARATASTTPTTRHAASCTTLGLGSHS